MVQIKTQLVKGGATSEEALLDDPQEQGETVRFKKHHLRGTLTCLSLLFGVCLTLILAVLLAMAPHCRSTPPSPLGKHRVMSRDLYTSSPGDVRKAKDYTRWLGDLADEIKCGVDCLFFNLAKGDDDWTPEQVPATPDTPKQAKAGQCDDVPLSQRFDCQPSAGASQEKCEALGCCWAAVKEVPKRERPFPAPRLHRPSHGHPLEELPLNVPFCYYPRDYSGYSFLNLTPSTQGQTGYLSRPSPSGYPGDVPLLKVEVFFETDKRIRVKITDPARARWETPLPMVPPSPNISAAQPAYTFEGHLADGTFTIARKSNGLPLFSTQGAAPLLYSEQLLQLSTLLPSDHLYGLGEHLNGLLLDTYWTRHVLWNLDQWPQTGKNLYGSHPFYLSMEPEGNAHGVFLLNSNAMDVVLQPLPALTWRTIGGVLDLYVFLGPSPSEVISQYTEVVGRPFLPPYWALGYHQCRFGYGSTNRTREVWQRTRDAGIPFDVQWNDIDYMEKNKDFTYDQEQYAGLPQFVEEVHKAGMHYVPIIDPGISGAEEPNTYPPWDEGLHLGVFVRNSSNLPFVGKVWNPVSTVWPDFTHPLSAYYWGRQMMRYHDQVAYDGAWIDMNEPSNFWSGARNGCETNNLENPPFLPGVVGDELYYKTLCMSARHHLGLHYNLHNLYGLTETIATSAALQIIRGKRPFVISRSTFPGQGHYGGHWTGDVQSDWFNMWQSIAGILNFNMFGIPMVGADICGFNGNTTMTLCMRWLQLGAFYPFSRNHNTDDALDQDPVALGEHVVESTRKALTQRYILLPYLYSLFFNAHLTGEPVARPLFFQFPDDLRTYPIDTQFLWGTGLMVLPVLREHVKTVEAYLPRGLWYDWYEGFPVQGEGTFVTFPAPYEHIPLLVRGGSILPTQLNGNTTTQSLKMGRGVVVAPDKEGQAEGELYWDDGDSLDVVSAGQYTRIQFLSRPGELTVKCSTKGYTAPISLSYAHILNVGTRAVQVTVAGKPVHYEYHAKNKVLSIKDFNQSLLEDFVVTWKF